MTATHEVKQVEGYRWAVFDAKGNRVSGGNVREIAERQADKLDAKPKFKTRKCLPCSEDFASEGIGNRVCPSCKKKLAGMASNREGTY